MYVSVQHCGGMILEGWIRKGQFWQGYIAADLAGVNVAAAKVSCSRELLIVVSS
jgi:hypothetical protein